MTEVGSKTFAEFVAELRAEYEANKTHYDTIPELQRFDLDDTYIGPPDDFSALPEKDLREWYESKRRGEVRRAKRDAARAEREFIEATCFPVPDYWDHKDGTVTSMIGHSHDYHYPTTYMLQIAPRT